MDGLINGDVASQFGGIIFTSSLKSDYIVLYGHIQIQVSNWEKKRQLKCISSELSETFPYICLNWGCFGKIPNRDMLPAKTLWFELSMSEMELA